MDFDRSDRLLSVLSFVLGYENLMENREQSKQNNVQSANDEQAKFLLKQLYAKFDEQNKMLADVIKRLEAIEQKL